MKQYQIVYADPAWPFRNKKTGGSMKSGAMAHYDVMDMDAMCALPLGQIAAENSALFMWWVASQPAEALRLVSAWGFTLKTMSAFTWVKETKRGADFFGMGFYTRQGSECCLIATKGRPVVASHSVRAVVRAAVGRHSEKPDIFRQRIVELMGDVPRVELFARQVAPGWDAWGNEIAGGIEL